ncbi:hypothetical protein HMPREF1550_01819 [Actinomyces sp. oral taxon 877 str. F0543]|nr:hypothetical protein HMPREF1550_01819 [Actinomyces sp. oral taxon 877 str. F0543]
MPTPIIHCLPQCPVVYPNASPHRLSTAARLPGHASSARPSTCPAAHMVLP